MAYISESAAAGQFVGWEDAAKICARVSDVRDLEGKPCWVEVDGDRIRFLRLWDSW